MSEKIIYKIIYEIKEIQDLINFYNVFDKYRKHIIIYINEYEKNKVNLIYHPISFMIESEIDNDYIIVSEEEKDYYINE